MYPGLLTRCPTTSCDGSVGGVIASLVSWMGEQFGCGSADGFRGNFAEVALTCDVNQCAKLAENFVFTN